jgi:hypothetical protein
MNATKGVVVMVLTLGLLWFVWEWGFCRFYVRPNEMAIIVTKTGTPLPPDQILAHEGQQGIQADVLGEGRHFRNPVFTDWVITNIVVIPAGKFAIVTSKVGKNPPEGEFMANDDEKGIWKRVLGPGKYRMNPHGYNIELVDAAPIPIGYAGVVTSLSGKKAPEGEFAAFGQKGVMGDILQPGLYYLNPKQYLVNMLEIGVNQVSLLGKEGGAVITKGLIDTGNSPMDELQRNAIQQQQKTRKAYYSKSPR